MSARSCAWFSWTCVGAIFGQQNRVSSSVSPKNLADVSKISSENGDRYAVFLPLKPVTDQNTAKVILNALQAR
jgi:hypothetical protein